MDPEISYMSIYTEIPWESHQLLVKQEVILTHRHQLYLYIYIYIVKEAYCKNELGHAQTTNRDDTKGQNIHRYWTEE